MGKEEYVLPRSVTMSAEAADQLLAAADGDAALLYIYILKNDGKLNMTAAAEKLKLGNRINGAMETLRRLGLVSGCAPAADAAEAPKAKAEAPRRLVTRGDSLPEYTVEDAKTMTRENPAFAALVKEIQSILGTVLSSNGLIELMGFYDYLGLPPDVILILTAHCTAEYEKKYGEGKRPTMRTLRSEAYRWAEREIFTQEAALEYIRKSSLIKKRKNELRRLLGLQDRMLAPTEDRYVSDWAAQEYSDELVRAAYDKTILNTGRMAWKYMDAILKSWQQKGLSTLEDIREKDRRSGSAEPAAQRQPEASGTEELERMKEYLKKLKQS